MKKLFLALFLACAAFASPVSEHGALSFNSEGVLVDKSGNPYQLRGMSLYWDRWGGENFHNEGVLSTLASTDANTGWGANVVRVPNSNLNIDKAKAMIDAAMNNGIYIIVDYHSHCAHKKQSDSENFFSQVSAYVKNKGYSGKVLYELYNEPVFSDCGGDANDRGNEWAGTTSWSTIKSYAEGVIKKIRANDAQGIILVGTPKYSQGIGSASENPITSTSNVGYVLHFYASDQYHASLKDALARARCKNLPVFITEWGTSEASGDGALQWDRINGWMAWIEAVGVSWANWSLSSMGESSAALNGGSSSNGGWQEYQLSASGKFVRKMISGLNSGKSVSQLGLTAATLPNCSVYGGSQSFEFVRDGKGSFGVRFDAENFTDASGVKTLTDKNTNAAQSMFIQTESSNGSWASYTMSNVPEENLYSLGIWYSAPNKDVELKYSVDGVIRSVKLSKTSSAKTFSAEFSPVTLKAGVATFKFDLKGFSPEDFYFDAFLVNYMDEADSIAFGLKNEDGSINEDFKEPIVGSDSNDGTDSENDGSQAITPSVLKTHSIRVDRNSIILENGDASNVKYNVMDVQGRILSKGVMTGNKLDLSNLSPGRYVARFTINGVGISKYVMIR